MRRLRAPLHGQAEVPPLADYQEESASSDAVTNQLGVEQRISIQDLALAVVLLWARSESRQREIGVLVSGVHRLQFSAAGLFLENGCRVERPVQKGLDEVQVPSRVAH